MSRLSRWAVAVSVVGAVLSTTSWAHADQADLSPGQLCVNGRLFVIDYHASYPGATGTSDGLYLRSIPTMGGCASSWAHRDGQLSTSAITAQCRTGIEKRFGPYPITIRFAETHVLGNRAACIRVMSAVARGDIDPGPAPLFPGGSP